MRKLLMITILALYCIPLFSQDKGHIQVEAGPGISIYINDRFIAETTVELNGMIINDLNPGVYRLRAEKPGFTSQEDKITIRAGEVFIFQVNLNIPDVKVIQEGDRHEHNLDLRVGTLKVQSVPFDILIKIPWLDLEIEKTENIWKAEDLAIGSYSISFHWQGEVLYDTVTILEDKEVSLFVNFVEMKIYYPGSPTKIIRREPAVAVSTPPDRPIEDDPPVISGKTFTDGRDGKKYAIVNIGGQTWLASNLNFNTGSGSWCYENDAANCQKFGRLYNWNAAVSACPGGWHLPTDADWKKLEMFMGMSDLEAEKLYWRGNGEGAQLKQGGSAGFNALLSGRRNSGGDYGYFGTYGYYWTSTKQSESSAWYRLFFSDNELIYRFRTNTAAGYGVRCVQD
jgi:uncharacterized protein (TIGR02145 family)